jgi:hypothetical protein
MCVMAFSSQHERARRSRDEAMHRDSPSPFALVAFEAQSPEFDRALEFEGGYQLRLIRGSELANKQQEIGAEPTLVSLSRATCERQACASVLEIRHD